jgi:hypothetical protein
MNLFHLKDGFGFTKFQLTVEIVQQYINLTLSVPVFLLSILE